MLCLIWKQSTTLSLNSANTFKPTCLDLLWLILVFCLLSSGISLKNTSRASNVHTKPYVEGEKPTSCGDNDGCREAEGLFCNPIWSSGLLPHIPPLEIFLSLWSTKSLWRLSANWWINICANVKRALDKRFPPSSICALRRGGCAWNSWSFNSSEWSQLEFIRETGRNPRGMIRDWILFWWLLNIKAPFWQRSQCSNETRGMIYILTPQMLKPPPDSCSFIYSWRQKKVHPGVKSPDTQHKYAHIDLKHTHTPTTSTSNKSTPATKCGVNTKPWWGWIISDKFINLPDWKFAARAATTRDHIKTRPHAPTS